MSFLSGGAECSTSSNPLSQFSKHVQDDNSLQRDRLASGHPNGAAAGFRSTSMGPSQDAVRCLPPPHANQADNGEKPRDGMTAPKY